MADLAALLNKEFTQSSSPTSGITAYGNTGKAKKKVKLKAGTSLGKLLKVFDPDQPRDERGRWGSGGAGHADATGKTSIAAYAAGSFDSSATQESILSKFSEADQKELLEKIEQAKGEPTSQETYFKNGQWTAERQALHQEIAQKFLNAETIAAATPLMGEQPQFVVLGGRGGSGKSMFTDGRINEFDASKFIKLDSDKIKESLIPPYAGYNAFNVHEESAEIMEAISARAAGLGLNILHDSTVKSMNVEKDIIALKAQGYGIQGHYMYLPPQEAAVRAVKRYLGDGEHDRGRLVPPAVVLGMTKNEANFDALKGYFDKWSAWDNNVPKGSPAKFIDRGGA